MPMKDRSFLQNYQYVFDEQGLYGGDQHGPSHDPMRYAGIVRKYFKKYTDKQIEDRLKLLATEGCGYVALINTVFLRFYGQADEFEKVFGFPMYTPDGRLNFNDLIVDFYCATDNHNQWLFFDSFEPKEDAGYEKGFGTTEESREWRFELYMRKHGIPVDVKSVIVMPLDVEKALKKSPVVADICPVILYDKDGNIAYQSKAGHSLTVTGTGDNGLIRVSSWSKEYYIKPGAYAKRENYQKIFYRK